MIQTLNTNSDPQFSSYRGLIETPIYGRGTRMKVLAPTQIAGLVPLICPDQDPRLPAFSKCDCREWTNDDCYINPVFAVGEPCGIGCMVVEDTFVVYTPPTSFDNEELKNDHNMFLVEFPFFYQFQFMASAASNMSIEEWNGTQWITTTNLTDDTYGTFYDFGSLCTIWKGFDIDWQKILIAFGEGLYRFRITYDIFATAGFLVSEPFCLKNWSCAGTDVTVRWETVMKGGRLGSIVDDKRIFEFCCTGQSNGSTAMAIVNQITWSDQLRVYAFFGREKTEYERVNVEYQNGEIIQVSNEAIQKFEYESALQPKWIHDRLKAYAFMADELYVTDYNWNNSDYEIDRKRVTCDGSYEPEYNENTRYSNVKVAFKEGFQNVIRDRCCSTNNNFSNR